MGGGKGGRERQAEYGGKHEQSRGLKGRLEARTEQKCESGQVAEQSSV